MKKEMPKSSALDVKFDSDAGENLTVREYFKKILEKLWIEGEGFSGKRPFGNSGWEYDLYTPLIKAGFIPGELDDDGEVFKFDKKTASKYVLSLVGEALKS